MVPGHSYPLIDMSFTAFDRPIPERHCRMSALHGLGHLPHESKEAIIRRFLSANQDVDDEMRQYAEDAIAGRVL